MEASSMEGETPLAPVIEPKIVVYCKICSIPPEYCMYGSCREKCKKWLASAEEHADLFAKLYPEEAAPKAQENPSTSTTGELSEAMEKVVIADGEDEDKKHQSRGGKGLPRDQSSKAEKEAQKRAKSRITITMSERNRRKAITNIRGLEAFGLDLKKVAKRLAGKYACGCSVVKTPSGVEEVALQGDFQDDIGPFLVSEYPEINSNQIDVIYK